MRTGFVTATPICPSRTPREPRTQKPILKLKTQRPPIFKLKTATPQHKSTTQGHAARTICLCINSYKSAEQMTCVEETIALPPAARRCSEETFFVLVLVAVRFALWTMMAELCFSVDDFILDFFSNTAADTAREYDSYGHRRCWTTAASCPYYSRAYGSFCLMCDFLGRMVLLKKRLRSNFCAAAWCGSRRGETSFAFCRCKHTPQAIGPAAAETQQRRAPSTLAAAVSRGQGLYCLCLLYTSPSPRD